MAYSILIPVYNTDISQLVHELHQQALATNMPFEILLMDDCSELSTAFINRKVEQLEGVTYTILSENIGRAKIRNRLFQVAEYEKCIVLDSDMAVIKVDYILNYLKALESAAVVVGGHVYKSNKPTDNNKHLHWWYGSSVERRLAKDRNEAPYSSFMTGNFAIRKSTFEAIRFDERLVDYGHEDTLFGMALEQHKVSITHIDNALLHLGLDDAKVFLAKQGLAVRNLKKLYKTSNNKSLWRKQVKLVRAAGNPLIKWTASLLRGFISSNLQSSSPKVWCLQLQKVLWWHEKN